MANKNLQAESKESDDDHRKGPDQRTWWLCAFLLLAITAYAMVSGNSQILSRVLEVAMFGLLAQIGIDIFRRGWQLSSRVPSEHDNE